VQHEIGKSFSVLLVCGACRNHCIILAKANEKGRIEMLVLWRIFLSKLSYAVQTFDFDDNCMH